MAGHRDNYIELSSHGSTYKQRAVVAEHRLRRPNLFVDEV